MYNAKDRKMGRLVSIEEGKLRIKEDWKRISNDWGVKDVALTEGENGLLFHLEFDDEEKFAKFTDYLRAQGLLGEDEIPTGSKKVH